MSGSDSSPSSLPVTLDSINPKRRRRKETEEQTQGRKSLIMPPNSLRSVVAQMHRGVSRKASTAFRPLPPHIDKGDVGFVFFQKKRLFSTKEEPDPFYEFRCGPGSNIHPPDFYSSVMEEIPENELVEKTIERVCRSGEVDFALDVFTLVKDKGLLISPRIVFILVKALAVKKKAEESKVLLQEMISKGSFPGNEIFNAVVYACSRNGDPDGAREVLKQMESTGLTPDVYTYTMVISGYANRGLMMQAEEILAEAKQKHEKLSPVTYQALIQGFFKAEQYEDILKLFEDRDLFGVKPRGDEYTKLIQSFCLVAMDWRSAEMLHKEMKRKNMQLDPISTGYIDSLRAMDPYAPKGQYDTSLSYFRHEFTNLHADFLAAFQEMCRRLALFLFKIFPRLGVWLGRALFAFDHARTRFMDKFLSRSRSERREYYDQEETARRVGGLLGMLIVSFFVYLINRCFKTWKEFEEISVRKKQEEDKKDKENRRNLWTAMCILQSLSIPSITHPNAVLEAERDRLARFKR